MTDFPLHDDEDLDRLYKQWNTFSPPLEGIRSGTELKQGIYRQGDCV